jgi:hypothetical protein
MKVDLCLDVDSGQITVAHDDYEYYLFCSEKMTNC